MMPDVDDIKVVAAYLQELLEMEVRYSLPRIGSHDDQPNGALTFNFPDGYFYLTLVQHKLMCGDKRFVSLCQPDHTIKTKILSAREFCCNRSARVHCRDSSMDDNDYCRDSENRCHPQSARLGWSIKPTWNACDRCPLNSPTLGHKDDD